MVWDWEWKEIFNLSLQMTSIWTPMCLLWRRARQVRTGKKCSTGPCKGHRYRQQWVSFEGESGGGHQSRNGKKCSCKRTSILTTMQEGESPGWCGRQRRGNDKRQTTYFFLPKDINDVYSMCTAEGRKLCRVHQSAWQREVSRKIVLEWITLWKRATQWKVIKETGNSS